MRVVLDTNVVLSALLWRGTPYQLLEAIRQQQHVQLVSSATLVAELADVLTRPKSVKRLAVIEMSRREVLAGSGGIGRADERPARGTQRRSCNRGSTHRICQPRRIG